MRGEGECIRLIMCLVALRLRERTRQTETQEERNRSEGIETEKTRIVFSIIPPPVHAPAPAGPPTA